MGRKYYDQYGACHSRIIFDEAHYYKNSSTKIITFISNLNGCFKTRAADHYEQRPGGWEDDRPLKWFLSGTPVGTLPADLAGSSTTPWRPSWDDELRDLCAFDIKNAD